jgi:hypothetical protein
MTPPVSSKRALFWRKLVIDLSIMTVIGIVLAVIGPFGSAAQPLALRLPIWIGFAWLGYAIYNPMGYFVERFGAALNLPGWGLWTGFTLLATVPMSIAVWCIGFLPAAPAMPSASEALGAYLNVLVIGASITVIFILIERSNQAKPEPAAGSAPTQAEVADGADIGRDETRPRFLDRLPPELGTALLALEMEDHYVRAHTALGSDLILLRMRDAVAELGDLEGAQIHRSWWVARGAVRDVVREGRNLRLVLENGLEAPVSRAKARPLRDAGWF